jgi:hypothetical protein
MSFKKYKPTTHSKFFNQHIGELERTLVIQNDFNQIEQ